MNEGEVCNKRGRERYIRNMSRDGHSSRKLFLQVRENCADPTHRRRTRKTHETLVLVVVLYRTHVELYDEFFFFKSNSSVISQFRETRRGQRERNTRLRVQENLNHTHKHTHTQATEFHQNVSSSTQSQQIVGRGFVRRTTESTQPYLFVFESLFEWQRRRRRP